MTGTLDSTIVILAFPTIAEKLRTDISAAIGLSSLLDFDRPSVYGFLGINISAKRGQVGRIRKWVGHLCSISSNKSIYIKKGHEPWANIEGMDRSLEHYALAGQKKIRIIA